MNGPWLRKAALHCSVFDSTYCENRKAFPECVRVQLHKDYVGVNIYLNSFLTEAVDVSGQGLA